MRWSKVVGVFAILYNVGISFSARLREELLLCIGIYPIAVALYILAKVLVYLIESTYSPHKCYPFDQTINHFISCDYFDAFFHLARR